MKFLQIIKNRKVRVVAVLLALGLLFGAGFFAYLYFTGFYNKPTQILQEKIDNSNKLFFNALDEARQGKYDSAQSTMDNALNNAQSNTDKAYIYTQKSSLAINVEKYDDAYNFAKSAEELNPNLSSAQLMAMSAEKKGDFQVAIDNYRNALNRMPSGSGVDEFDRQDIINKIKNLGGGV